MALIQPSLDQAQNAANLQLSERGIPIGSEVYKNEQNRVAANAEQARESIANQATQAAGAQSQIDLQNALAAYNAPFNALASVEGGTSVQNPSFTSTPAYQVAAPDIAGLTEQNYQNQLNQYNQQNSSFLNGLFGLGSAALSLIPSDIRLKTDIRRMGITESGVPLYAFRYKTGGPVQIGVMAQELEKFNPSAVHEINGVKYVNYAMVN